jgi:ribosomal protein S18 acetylase RimI-like enzyme
MNRSPFAREAFASPKNSAQGFRSPLSILTAKSQPTRTEPAVTSAVSYLEQTRQLLSGRFPPGEVDVESYIGYCELYYITEDRDVYRPNTFSLRADSVMAVCFVKNGIVYLVCTRDGYEGMGYAKQLMTAVIEDSPELTLTVRSKNLRARGLYESLGFVVTEVKANFYDYTADVDDGCVMVRKK